MFDDKDAELRKHGAFAITQSKSPSITADLIRLGNTDKDGDVRAQAWFWLAHTGAPNAEYAIARRSGRTPTIMFANTPSSRSRNCRTSARRAH